MKRIKLFLRRMAGRVVTYYCNRIYRKAVQRADGYHAEHRDAYYVITDPANKYQLVTISRRHFRKMKHDAQRSMSDMLYWSRDYNMRLVKDGCWYHTPDRGENNPMSPRQKELMRLVFIKSGLMKAGLVEKK